MRFSPGEVVLLSFPFTNDTAAKQLPALVVYDSGDDDLVVARVTSQPSKSEYDVPISRWQNAGLLAASISRLHKLATIEKRLVRKKLGQLDDLDWSAAQSALKRIFCRQLRDRSS
jgi:mRNA interferase MazF